jgi:hypothetical protein
MSAVGRAWETAVARGKPDESLHNDAARLLAEVAVLEDYARVGSRRMLSNQVATCEAVR